MIVTDNAVADCERKFTAAGRLAQAAADVGTDLLKLMRLLDETTAADPGFQAGEAASDAIESMTIARRAMRDVRRIIEAHETDLADQLKDLRATDEVSGHGA
jgi:hypothetical protein